MSYQWNWGIFLSPAASGDSTYLGWMLSGLQTTILLSLSAWVIALALGSLMGVLRTVPGKWLSGIAATYVEVFRNIPLLVQLFIWYFVLPEVLPFGLGERFKQDLDPLTQQFVSAMLCLAFFTSARVCEQVRSGINALPRGQKNAGLALGFTLPQTYRHVLLPMAFRLVVPPLTLITRASRRAARRPRSTSSPLTSRMLRSSRIRSGRSSRARASPSAPPAASPTS